MATNIDPAEVVKQVTTRLAERYPDTSHETIAALAAEELEKISNSKVTDYFAVLTERAVRKRLKR